FLSAGAPQQLSPKPATYEFDLRVPDEKDLGYVFAVTPSANAVRADFVPLIVHDHLAADSNATPSSRTAIWLIAVVWSIAGALCFSCWRESTAAGRRF